MRRASGRLALRRVANAPKVPQPPRAYGFGRIAPKCVPSRRFRRWACCGGEGEQIPQPMHAVKGCASAYGTLDSAHRLRCRAAKGSKPPIAPIGAAITGHLGLVMHTGWQGQMQPASLIAPQNALALVSPQTWLQCHNHQQPCAHMGIWPNMPLGQ